MGNDKRQEYCAEIKRLKEACKKSKSKYLKNDYGKRIKRMKKQLAYYDYCHKNRRKMQWQPITDRSQTEARQPVNTTRLAETPKTASVLKDTARRPKMTWKEYRIYEHDSRNNNSDYMLDRCNALLDRQEKVTIRSEEEITMPNFEERDCENCVHRVPRIREDGGWTADCECWDCEYLSRKECIEAWKQINGGKT